MLETEDQDEGERDEAADEVAREHDFAAVEAVEGNAGDGSGENRRQGARNHDSADSEPRPGEVEGQAKDRDAVEVIADFADDLSQPGVAVVGWK